MAIALTGGIALVLIVLAVFGYLRDLRRGMLALLGTLGGAILVDFWGAPWGASLAARFSTDIQRATLWVSCMLFLWCALGVGYGGAVLLPTLAGDRAIRQRLMGALLGLVNGLLIVGFLLRYAFANEANASASLAANVLANALYISLPWLFLGAALTVSVLAIGRGIMTLMQNRAAAAPASPSGAAPATRSAPPGVPASPGEPDRRIGTREVLGKINEVNKR
jgi:hypothetical protein